MRADEGLLFALVFLAFIFLLLFFSRKFNKKLWEKIDAKKNEKLRARREEQLERLPPQLEKQKLHLREKLLPAYLEAFRDAPIGYWTDPRDDYSRVVSFTDWKFHEEGTGEYIFYTLGSGETSYPFTWKTTGERQLLIESVLIKADRDEYESDEEYKEDPGHSYLPAVTTLKYNFEAEDFRICLVREGYVKNEKQEIGRLDVLCLSGGVVKEKLDKI